MRCNSVAAPNIRRYLNCACRKAVFCPTSAGIYVLRIAYWVIFRYSLTVIFIITRIFFKYTLLKRARGQVWRVRVRRGRSENKTCWRTLLLRNKRLIMINRWQRCTVTDKNQNAIKFPSESVFDPPAHSFWDIEPVLLRRRIIFLKEISQLNNNNLSIPLHERII